MPTREAIVTTTLPKEVEKPLPTRTVSTRTPKVTDQIGDQPHTVKSEPVVAESTKTEESVRLSPQVSALARKEQAHRQREQALKEKETSFGAKLSLADKHEKLMEKLKAKDYSALEELGGSYDAYTEWLLNKKEGEKPEAQEIKAIKDELAEMKKSQEENESKQFEATVAEYRKEIKKFVETNPDFSGLKDAEAQEAVLQVILDDFEKDETETSIEDAAKDVKAYLVEEAKKLSVFLEQPAKVEETNASETKRALPPPKPTGLKTLTQQVTMGGDDKPLKSLQYMSESERYAEARRRALAKRAQALAAQGKQ